MEKTNIDNGMFCRRRKSSLMQPSQSRLCARNKCRAETIGSWRSKAPGMPASSSFTIIVCLVLNKAAGYHTNAQEHHKSQFSIVEKNEEPSRVSYRSSLSILSRTRTHDKTRVPVV